MPAVNTGHEHALVLESAWSAGDAGPLPVLTDLVACSIVDESHTPDARNASPVVFSPPLHARAAHVVPVDGELRLPGTTCAAIGASEGSLLPRLVQIELRRTGDACLYHHERRLPDGSPYRVSALYVPGPPGRGLPVHGALVRLLHAF